MGKGNRNYKRGYQTEYRCVKSFDEIDPSWATRSPSSKGMFDVTAVTREGTFLIQLKRTKRKAYYSAYRHEIEGIQEWLKKWGRKPSWLHCQFWVWTDRKGWTKYNITKTKVEEI
ncbi:hypothetical protein LC065_20195 (plasmid) [Halobacillus litoralis]|uniref:hypothetical protein n=1 Tax=Halobacillus litoralis TaxID=45668 RepID=UPI001CFCA406|nr:hypothetical protein [Halobacillus litoralis]WLR49567.1 hypothetical protein LC065_20195 [Halobacillus litoralis]